MKAIATLSFRFIPPLNLSEKVFCFSNSATSSIADVMPNCASSKDFPEKNPFIRAKNSRCSLTVNWGKRQSCCRQTPMFLRMLGISLPICFPKTVPFPDVGTVIPVSIFIVVVLPAPL